MKLSLPIITYCGIYFGHSKWNRHLHSCLICSEEHQNKKEKLLNEWNNKCKCGCGKITNYGNKYISGHNSVKWSIERKKYMSNKFSGSGNPMYGKSSWSRGKTKHNDDSLMSMSIKMSVKVKEEYKNGIRNVSGKNNPMYGKSSWNSGLTKYDDERIRIYGKKISKIRLREWDDMSENDKDIKRKFMAYIGSRCKKKSTIIEIKIKNFLDNINILYEHNYLIGKYSVDFYLPEFNLVIECNGDYWHANPKKYKLTELNEIQKNNMRRDERKKMFLEKNDINYIFLWEYDINNNFNHIKKIIFDFVL